MPTTQTIQTTPSAAIDAFGGPEQLRAYERPVTPPGADQVQIKVAAAAVNPVDLTTRAGKNISEDDARFPMTLGWDAAGIVEAIGDGVTGWQVGDRVAAMTFQPLDQNGTYTEHLTLAAELVAHVPENVSLEVAATVPLAALTAHQLVTWVDVPAGGTLLIDAPLGAVGRFAVQLARQRGITVVAVVKPEDRDDALRLGASETVERGDFTAAVRALHPAGVDAAIDLVGGSTAHASLASVRGGGAYITAVPPYMDKVGPFTAERDVRLEVQIVHPDTPVLTGLLDAVGRGELTSTVERTYPLADAGEAHRRQSEGGLRGKLVLVP